MTQSVLLEKFRVDYSEGKGYAIYTKRANGYYRQEVYFNRLGTEIFLEVKKISANAYEFAKPHGVIIY